MTTAERHTRESAQKTEEEPMSQFIATVGGGLINTRFIVRLDPLPRGPLTKPGDRVRTAHLSNGEQLIITEAALDHVLGQVIPAESGWHLVYRYDDDVDGVTTSIPERIVAWF